MNCRHLSAALVVCLAAAAPASADVTVKQKNGGKGMAAAATGESTMFLKGQKMRTDSNVSGSRSTIIDAATRQMVVLIHDKKEAEVLDMAKISESMAKAGVGEIKMSIDPTTETRQIAGATCTVYNVKISVPVSMGNMAMTMVMSGPYCLVKNGPGQADFSAFFKAAAEHGLFLDQNSAKGQPGLAKAMVEMQKKMSELGVPYASEITVGMEASGPMADMMKKMGTTITSEVTAVSTAAIPDSTFEIPAGYKVNKR